MKECSHLLDARSPKDVRVFQVTPDHCYNSLVYCDTPVFLKDGRSFVYHGGEGAMIWNGEDGSSRPIFSKEEKKGSPIVTSDCRCGYYITQLEDGEIAFCRKDLETLKADVMMTVKTIPGTSFPASRMHWGGAASTISLDNRRVACLAWLGDGTKPMSPFGAIVFDLIDRRGWIALQDPEIPSAHLQYCQCPDGDASHDLMVQNAHGCQTDEKGSLLRLVGPPSDKGCDIHVIRDDGTNWRDLPWGRDGKESCIGHQMWRGRGKSAVTVTLENDDLTYGRGDDTRQGVVEGFPIKAERNAHLGLLNPGCKRNVLSRNYPNGRFCHLYVDPTGLRFAFDSFSVVDYGRTGQRIYSAVTRDLESAAEFTYVLNAGNTFKECHAHPILSPDGKRLFFNSNVSGQTQIYMAEGPGLYGGK